MSVKKRNKKKNGAQNVIETVFSAPPLTPFSSSPLFLAFKSLNSLQIRYLIQLACHIHQFNAKYEKCNRLSRVQMEHTAESFDNIYLQFTILVDILFFLLSVKPCFNFYSHLAIMKS